MYWNPDILQEALTEVGSKSEFDSFLSGSENLFELTSIRFRNMGKNPHDFHNDSYFFLKEGLLNFTASFEPHSLVRV